MAVFMASGGYNSGFAESPGSSRMTYADEFGSWPCINFHPTSYMLGGLRSRPYTNTVYMSVVRSSHSSTAIQAWLALLCGNVDVFIYPAIAASYPASLELTHSVVR
jgi:hypothetical protein